MPSGDDDEIVARCAALLVFGEDVFGDRRLVGLFADELFASERFFGEVLTGALLAAGRNVLE